MPAESTASIGAVRQSGTSWFRWTCASMISIVPGHHMPRRALPENGPLWNVRGAVLRSERSEAGSPRLRAVEHAGRVEDVVDFGVGHVVVVEVDQDVLRLLVHVQVLELVRI